MFDISWDTLLPFIFVVITSLISIGIVKKSVIGDKIVLWIRKLLMKTATVSDDQLFDITLQHYKEYIQSDAFKAHWRRIEDVLTDGKLTPEDVAEIKKILAHDMAVEIKQYACDIYSEHAKPAIEQLIDDAGEFLKNKTQDLGYLKRTGVSLILSMLKSWLKCSVNSTLQSRGLIARDTPLRRA